MVEETEYSVLRTIARVELRRYSRIALATVRGLTDDQAFSMLFRYISGDNSGSTRIPMTTPVMSARDGDRIPMTAPVLSDESSFSFVLPKAFTSQTAPIPTDGRIEIEDVSDRTVAVLRFRGRGSASQVNEKTGELLTVLRNNGIQIEGRPFLMRYNPPFIPGVFRRNEVGVAVKS